MKAVFQEVMKKRLAECTLLDVGASTGIIAHYLSRSFARVTGIDIDESAISYAKSAFRETNLTFQVGDAMNLRFPDSSFDAVICAHVYEHVPDARKMFDEIHRILKPGGACYFSAGNRLALTEPHYKLWFLSIMPRPLAHVYLRVRSRGNYYYEKHLTLWGLKRLTKNFIRIDFTPKIVKEPGRYHLDYLIKDGSMKAKTAAFALKHFYWAFPNYIWVLKKPFHVKQ